ncbi:MAG TPA: GNAT family N-acetyltransferase [Chloroflexota bacterium]|nr:GNAT family N-acetyltransferase [Chloroflexota bacterium]
MPPIIREFQPKDYAAVAELWEASGIRTESLEDVRFKLQRDPELFLVAEDGGDIVGVVLGTFDGRFGSVNRLAITESHRRGGLASALLERVEDSLRAKGARRVWAWIEGHNQASRALFARNGYEEWQAVVTATKTLLPPPS